MKKTCIYCIIIILAVYAAAMIKNPKPSISSTLMEPKNSDVQFVSAPVRIQECAAPSTSAGSSSCTFNPCDYAGLERILSGAGRLLENINSMPLAEYENKYNEILRSYQEARIFYNWGRLGEPENSRLLWLLTKLTAILRSLDDASRRNM